MALEGMCSEIPNGSVLQAPLADGLYNQSVVDAVQLLTCISVCFVIEASDHDVQDGYACRLMIDVVCFICSDDVQYSAHDVLLLLFPCQHLLL